MRGNDTTYTLHCENLWSESVKTTYYSGRSRWQNNNTLQWSHATLNLLQCPDRDQFWVCLQCRKISLKCCTMYVNGYDSLRYLPKWKLFNSLLIRTVSVLLNRVTACVHYKNNILIECYHSQSFMIFPRLFWKAKTVIIHDRVIWHSITTITLYKFMLRCLPGNNCFMNNFTKRIIFSPSLGFQKRLA